MGSNARDIGPALTALATELRMEVARRTNLTYRELARTSGVPYPTLRKSIRGERMIDVEELFKIARALDLKPSQIVEAAEQRLRLEGMPDQNLSEGLSSLGAVAQEGDVEEAGEFDT